MTRTRNAIETGLYLYGITTAEGALPAETLGVAGGSVERVVEGPVAAIVTRLSVNQIRPERSNLAAHNRTLQGLANGQAVLPVAFGTIVDSERELRSTIRRNREPLVDKLRLLQDRVEMILKLYWDTPNIFEYFVTTHEELRKLRDRAFGGGRKPSRSQSIELGEVFASLLQQAREHHTDRVTKALSRYCVEIQNMDAGEEKLVVKLACLVEKGRVEQWEEGVQEAARLFDNNYCFKYGNPSIPYNFANVNLVAVGAS